MDPSSSNLNKLAIDAALDSKWTEALKLNRQIIKVDPQNVDALNRQARCYMELGKNNLAKKYYAEALKIDPYNPIAAKNLKIIKSLHGSLNHGSSNKSDGSPHIADGQVRIAPGLFLQEPGKTKVVNLLKVAEPKTLSQTFCGMSVNMLIKNKKIIIVDSFEAYLGVLPDDISHHLVRLIKGGNKYNIVIKSVRVNGLSVLIREINRSKRFKNQPSFLEGSQYPISDVITALDSQEPEEDGEEQEEEV